VSYGWVGVERSIERTQPHLLYMGIVRPVSSTVDSPVHIARMKSWGLNTSEALEVAIISQQLDQFEQLVSNRPEADFLISTALARQLKEPLAPEIRVHRPDHVLLESRCKKPAGDTPMGLWDVEIAQAKIA